MKTLLILVLILSPALAASPFVNCDCVEDMMLCSWKIEITDINKTSGETTISHTDGTVPVDISGWILKYENKVIELSGILNSTEKMAVSTPFNSSQTNLRSMKLTSPLLQDMVLYR